MRPILQKGGRSVDDESDAAGPDSHGVRRQRKRVDRGVQAGAAPPASIRRRAARVTCPLKQRAGCCGGAARRTVLTRSPSGTARPADLRADDGDPQPIGSSAKGGRRLVRAGDATERHAAASAAAQRNCGICSVDGGPRAASMPVDIPGRSFFRAIGLDGCPGRRNLPSRPDGRS